MNTVSDRLAVLHRRIEENEETLLKDERTLPLVKSQFRWAKKVLAYFNDQMALELSEIRQFPKSAQIPSRFDQRYYSLRYRTILLDNMLCHLSTNIANLQRWIAETLDLLDMLYQQKLTLSELYDDDAPRKLSRALDQV